jgi:hypothetical protein
VAASGHQSEIDREYHNLLECDAVKFGRSLLTSGERRVNLYHTIASLKRNDIIIQVTKAYKNK